MRRLAALLPVAVLTACGGSGAVQDTSGQFGRLTVEGEDVSYVVHEAAAQPLARVAATFDRPESGCAQARVDGKDMLALFPRGTTVSAQGFTLPDGSTIRWGAPTDVGGGVLPVDAETRLPSACRPAAEVLQISR